MFYHGLINKLVRCCEFPMKDFQKEFGEKMIASVSRSFYLSLRFLPSEMRGTASLAYLLARATDTVADTNALPEDDRLEFLEAMKSAINGGEEVPPLDSSFLECFLTVLESFWDAFGIILGGHLGYIFAFCTENVFKS